MSWKKSGHFYFFLSINLAWKVETPVRWQEVTEETL